MNIFGEEQTQGDHVQTMREIGASLVPSPLTGEYPEMPARPTLPMSSLRLHKPKFGLPIAAAAMGPSAHRWR
jgi:hypothetical protein